MARGLGRSGSDWKEQGNFWALVKFSFLIWVLVTQVCLVYENSLSGTIMICVLSCVYVTVQVKNVFFKKYPSCTLLEVRDCDFIHTLSPALSTMSGS